MWIKINKPFIHWILRKQNFTHVRGTLFNSSAAFSVMRTSSSIRTPPKPRNCWIFSGTRNLDSLLSARAVSKSYREIYVNI